MLSKIELLALCILLPITVGGCGSSRRETYVPSEVAGKQALETALSAWQNGKPLQRIESEGRAAVQPQDSDWQKGKKLASYSIGNELPATEGPKQFSVQLTFQGEAKPVNTVYFVVGRDPIWVFRDRDYQKVTGT